MSLTAALVACTALLASCASAADPPGGPPDPTPPAVVRITPESGSVLVEPPRSVEIVFDEVINERIQGQRPGIAGAVILSPVRGETRVSWRRNRIELRPREGFQPGRVYHVELLPVIRDLRDNRIPRGRVVIFSTGPELPAASLSGTLVDWAAARGAVRGLIEAVLMPDSLPYRTLTDSSGDFAFPPLPPGEYLVWGVLDQDGDRNRGAREGFDTVRVRLDSLARADMYAFTHDTIGPRIRQLESPDSLTVRVQFDRPLDPAARIDPSRVLVVAADDDTAPALPVTDVFTQRQVDSARAAAAAQRDSAADSAAARAPEPPARERAPQAPARPGAVRAAPGGPPVRPDTTRAMRMIAARAAPTDVRFLRLGSPLERERRYSISIDSVRGLAGAVSSPRAQLRLARPRPAATPAAPPTPRDTTARDTSAAASRE